MRYPQKQRRLERSADTVYNTLNIWNPSDLALFPSLVRRVSDYTVHTGRASIFYCPTWDIL